MSKSKAGTFCHRIYCKWGEPKFREGEFATFNFNELFIFFALTLLCPSLRTYPTCCALIFFALTLLCPHFLHTYPAVPLIFLRIYPAVPFNFFHTYPAVPVIFQSTYLAVSIFFFFGLTLLCLYFLHIPSHPSSSFSSYKKY